MSYSTLDIVRIADRQVKKYKTRDPYELAAALGIDAVVERGFRLQRGAYISIMRNRFIFVKKDLPEYMKRIVIWHELGHDTLHREEARASGGFQEFKLFETLGSRMEYQANIYAAQISLRDDEILEYIEEGYDLQQIASFMKTDVNLVALKNDALIAQGFRFRRQEHTDAFLRYDR